MDKIFVVVPVYKVEAYLDRCIGSILNQTYSNWELVLVNDGSPDNCPAICDRYAAEHENITVIHQENGGLSAARNAGIRYVQQSGDPHGSWITFIDSDDFIHPKYLEYLYCAAKEAAVRISICGYIGTDAWGVPSEELPFSYTVLSPEVFWCQDRTNATLAWGKLYQADCFDKIIFPAGKIHEDEFTTHQLLFLCAKTAVISLPLYYYYSNTSGITQSLWTPKRLHQLDALEAQVDYFERNNFPAARTESIAHLLQHSIKHVMYIKHLSPQYDHLIKAVAARRNRAFRLYAKEVGLKKAFDYWYQVRIKAPMDRVLKNESAVSFLKRRIKKKLHL